MKTLKYSILLLFGLLLNILGVGRATAQQVTAVLPYELMGGKMIVKMQLNGKEERFIFDTGASLMSLSGEYCREHNLSVVDSILLNDSSGIKKYLKTTRVNSVYTPDKKMRFTEISSVIMNEPSPVRCYNVVGIIGADMLSTMICTIDAKTKTILLSTPDVPYQESLRYAQNFTKEGILPVFNVLINGEDIQVLLDSGSGAFVNLKQTDFEKLKANGAVTVLQEGKGAKSVGITGQLDYARDQQVYISEMRLGPVKVADVVAETSNAPYTLLGTRFMQYAKIVIDYAKQRLYYVPYEQGPIKTVFGQTKFGITVNKQGKLAVTHVWKALDGVVDVGDIVTHIDGKETETYDLCDIVRGIPALRTPGPKMLTIQRKDGKSVEVEYKAEVVKVPQNKQG